MLRLNERDGLSWLSFRDAPLRRLILLGITLLRETLWIADALAQGVTLWRLLAWQLVPAALAYAVIQLDRHAVWPVATQRAAYLSAAVPVLLAVAAGAAVYANFNHPGADTALPYIPVASFFDAAQIAVIATMIAWSRVASAFTQRDLMPLVRAMPAVLTFIWLSAMAMRIAHHWGGVPFDTNALLASGIAQSMLSMLWTALALALMISATRKVLRERWFMGFVLLGIVGAKFILIDVVNKGTVTWTLSLIGVGLLILAASYFSPAPPRAAGASAIAAP